MAKRIEVKRPLAILDPETGETIEGYGLVLPKFHRHPYDKEGIQIRQDQLRSLAACTTLRPRALRAFLYLLGIMPQGNSFNLVQTWLVDDLQMSKSDVSSAISELERAGLIGRSGPNIAIPPTTAWKGKSQDLDRAILNSRNEIEAFQRTVNPMVEGILSLPSGDLLSARVFLLLWEAKDEDNRLTASPDDLATRLRRPQDEIGRVMERLANARVLRLESGDAVLNPDMVWEPKLNVIRMFYKRDPAFADKVFIWEVLGELVTDRQLDLPLNLKPSIPKRSGTTITEKAVVKGLLYPPPPDAVRRRGAPIDRKVEKIPKGKGKPLPPPSPDTAKLRATVFLRLAQIQADAELYPDGFVPFETLLVGLSDAGELHVDATTLQEAILTAVEKGTLQKSDDGRFRAKVKGTREASSTKEEVKLRATVFRHLAKLQADAELYPDGFVPFEAIRAGLSETGELQIDDGALRTIIDTAVERKLLSKREDGDRFHARRGIGKVKLQDSPTGSLADVDKDEGLPEADGDERGDQPFADEDLDA